MPGTLALRRIALLLLAWWLTVAATASAQSEEPPGEKGPAKEAGQEEGPKKKRPDIEREALTPAQQAAFLARRTGGQMLMGTFSGVTSYHYAAHDVCLHTDTEDVALRRLNQVFPKFYRPTWRELFDEIAQQTGTRWRYDPKRDYWVFDPPQRPLPYRIDLAEGWKAENRGSYLFTKPPGAPIGMDVYILGTYSFEEKDPEKRRAARNRVRYDLAHRFARSFKKDVTESDMTRVEVGGAEALHFKANPPRRPNACWRQWAFLAGGRGYVIVSIIEKENTERLLPDVQAMVKSFRLKKTDKQAAKKTGNG
jgi:hypothetical protein